MRAPALFLFCLLGLFVVPIPASVLVYSGTAHVDADNIERTTLNLPKKSRVYFIVDFESREVTAFYYFEAHGIKRYKEEATTGLQSGFAHVLNGRRASILMGSEENTSGDISDSRLHLIRGVNENVVLQRTPHITTSRPRVITFRDVKVGLNVKVATFHEILSTATLDSLSTIKANTGTDDPTSAKTVAEFRQLLEMRGYTPVP